jgi:hypothetical protein
MKPIPSSRLVALMFIAFALQAFAQSGSTTATTQSLAGTWQVRLDPEAVGESQQWAHHPLSPNGHRLTPQHIVRPDFLWPMRWS